MFNKHFTVFLLFLENYQFYYSDLFISLTHPPPSTPPPPPPKNDQITKLNQALRRSYLWYISMPLSMQEGSNVYSCLHNAMSALVVCALCSGHKKKKLAKNCYYLGHTKSHQFHKKDWVVHWHPVAPLSSSTPPRSSQSHDLGPHRRGREVAPPACWTPKPYLVGQLKTRVSWLMKHNWFRWLDGSKVDLWGSPLEQDCLPLCHPVW